MLSKTVVPACAVGLWLLAGCDLLPAAPVDSGEAAEAQPAQILAEIGEERITLEAFERHWRRPGGPGQQAGDADMATRERLGLALLERMVDSRLLMAEAKRRGLLPDTERVAREIEELEKDHGGRKLLEQVLHSGDTPGELVRRVGEKLAVEALLSVAAREAGEVTAEEIEARYQGNTDLYRRPEEVHALQIVVRTEEEAQRILEQLKGGESFRELARRYSIAPEGKRGGDLGFFAHGVMPDIFDEHCFGLKPGSTSAIIPSDYGYHIFKVLELRPAGLRPLKEVRDQIRDDLARARAQKAERELIARLRSQTPPRLFPERINLMWTRG